MAAHTLRAGEELLTFADADHVEIRPTSTENA
jgi:hypothetical protein